MPFTPRLLPLLLLLPQFIFGQQLQKTMAKGLASDKRFRASTGVAPVQPSHKAKTNGLIEAATEPPTITDFTPKTSHTGGTIKITGTNFDPSVKVSIGGTDAADVTVESNTALTVTVGSGATGNMSVKTNKGTATSADVFTYVPPPTISSVSPAIYASGTLITLIGGGFLNIADGGTKVVVDGTPATVTYISPTAITAQIAGPVTKGAITLTTVNGSVVYPTPTSPSDKPLGGNANFTLPDLGKDVLVVPTPTFTYTQIHPSKKFGFQGTVWANVLGTDSSRQRLVNKLIIPQTSLIGLQLEFNSTIIQIDTNFTLSAVGDFNILLKKISYVDTSAKNNFNPWFFHPRIGLVGTFYNNNLYAGFYYNFMSVLTEFDAYGEFFKTGGKNVFVYPEATIGGIFSISGTGNQQLKFELDGIFNNKNVNQLYQKNTGIIISVRAGFITNL